MSSKSNDPLELLFRDIQRDLAATNQRRSLEPPKPQISIYANPLNWRLGKVVNLIHRTEGSLGNFQEYFHSLSPTARRLLPAAQGLVPDRSELVFGDFWLHPKFSAAEPLEDSQAEIRAITLRFHQLMSEYEDE